MLAFTTIWMLAAFVLLGSAGLCDGRNSLPGLTAIETVCVDEHATGYGTFQSHNQKVVSNRNGIFMAHIRSRNEAYTAQQWRLSRSMDGGKTFSVVYEATHATNPPVIETDEKDNIYLIRPDFLDGNAYLYRFLASENYSRPHISTIPSGSAGKYCMIYDPKRKQLYYFAHNNIFFVIGLDGTVRSSRNLLQPGQNAALQYPALSLEPDGTLHAAWTTQKHGIYLYWDIHHMLSRDGGTTWQKMDGTSLTLPVIADQNGPTDCITLGDEFNAHTWLSSFMAKDGKVHFFYEAQRTPPREHYIRYESRTGRREIDRWPGFSGQAISIMNLDGFFATRATRQGLPLYCISVWNQRIACLASDDNGDTWYDYAVSERQFTPYGVGGCRELTADGYIIGSFTQSGSNQIYFLKIRAGLSTAKVASFRYEGHKAALSFSEIRGQPEQIRLGTAGGRWTRWQPFKPAITTPMQFRPTQFQLRSRLGVVSDSFDIPS